MLKPIGEETARAIQWLYFSAGCAGFLAKVRNLPL